MLILNLYFIRRLDNHELINPRGLVKFEWPSCLQQTVSTDLCFKGEASFTLAKEMSAQIDSNRESILKR